MNHSIQTEMHTVGKQHLTKTNYFNMSPSTTTRWCPTPEQLMILEDLYRRGVRTPNASQIQRITAHLSFYGKIQGKNVFYWFQNHKARDRQKLRKKLAKQLHQQQQQLLHQHLYQYQLDPQTHFTHTLDFQAPSAFHQLSNYFSTENLNPQGTTSGVCEEAPDGVIRQTWRADLPKDCLMRSYGHDSMMITDVGPTFPCCRSKPLETLELFPLRSPTANHQETTTSNLDVPLNK